MVYVSEETRWVREEQLNGCLANQATLCSAQIRAVASACASIGADPRVTQATKDEITALGVLGATLRNTYPGRPGEQVLTFPVVQRRLKRTLEVAATLRWLARYHPEALALFLAVCEASLQPWTASPEGGH